MALPLMAAFAPSSALAIGMGALRVESALGQPLRMEIALLGVDNGGVESRCFKARLTTMDGASLGPVSINLGEGQAAAIQLSTVQPITEPAVNVSVEFNCDTLSRREYQILLDLPTISPPVLDIPRPAATTSSADKRGSVVMPQMVSPTPQAADEDAQSRKHHRHHGHAGVPAGTPDAAPDKLPVATATMEPKESRHKKSKAVAFKSVLRLSGGDTEDDSLNGEDGMHLALSHSLGGSLSKIEEAPGNAQPAAAPGAVPAAGPVDLANPAAGAAAPGAVAPQNVDPALQELQAKIHVLEAETQELRKLNARDLSALDEAKKENEGGNSLVYLYLVVAVCLLAIGWLVWRMRQIQSEIGQSSWQEIVPEGDAGDEHVQPQADEDDFLEHEPPAPVSKKVTLLKQVPPLAAVEPPAVAADNVATAKPATAASGDDGGDGDYKFFSSTRSPLPNAEEILDEIQQAEFWMEMQQPERAIEILESNWGIDRPSSPLPWLYLFDLYRTVGDREKYDELTERFEQIFNGKVIPWGDGQVLEHSRSLEEFPFLLKKITDMWPTDELVPFMENLLVDDRDGRRQGFDLAAYRDILFLTNIAYEIQAAKSQGRPLLKIPEWSAIK